MRAECGARSTKVSPYRIMRRGRSGRAKQQAPAATAKPTGACGEHDTASALSQRQKTVPRCFRPCGIGWRRQLPRPLQAWLERSDGGAFGVSPSIGATMPAPCERRLRPPPPPSSRIAWPALRAGRGAVLHGLCASCAASAARRGRARRLFVNMARVLGVGPAGDCPI